MGARIMRSPIFLSASGKPWTTQRMSQTFRTLRDKLGLPRWICLYLTRHEHGTTVTHKLGLFEASKALGHADIKSTQRYAHITPRYKRAALNKLTQALGLEEGDTNG